LAGTAYQWIDDLDDVLALKSGAKRSNDLDEGKITAVVLAVRQTLKPAERRTFDRLLLNPHRQSHEYTRLQSMVERANVEPIVRREARQMITKALTSLQRCRSIERGTVDRLTDLSCTILGCPTE
jgi:geranylgeranyl pyrophosphate synthase